MTFLKWNCLTSSRSDIRSDTGPRLFSELEDMEWKTVREEEEKKVPCQTGHT